MIDIKTYCTLNRCSKKYEPHKHPPRVLKSVDKPTPPPEIERMTVRRRVMKSGDIDQLIADLSDKESQFIAFYMSNGFNGSAAYKSAGYKYKDMQAAARGAYTMLRKPSIRSVIDHKKSEMVGNSDVTADYVLKKIVRVVEKTTDEDSKTYSPSTALRGLELLAKHLGMFIERTEISGRDGDAIQLQKVQEDSAELASAITRLASRARKNRMAEDTDERATG